MRTKQGEPEPLYRSLGSLKDLFYGLGYETVTLSTPLARDYTYNLLFISDRYLYFGTAVPHGQGRDSNDPDKIQCSGISVINNSTVMQVKRFGMRNMESPVSATQDRHPDLPLPQDNPLAVEAAENRVADKKQ